MVFDHNSCFIECFIVVNQRKSINSIQDIIGSRIYNYSPVTVMIR